MAYLEHHRKAPGAALAKQAKELAMEVSNRFRAISPDPRWIYSSAAFRGFRTRRRTDSLTPGISGLSRAAWRRADSLLEGRRSQYFRVEPGVGSMPRLRRLRFSGVPRKIGNGVALRGGRRGNRFAKSALAADEINPDTLKAFLEANPNAKRMNRRALATHAELVYRTRAAAGHTMAVQWLPKVWKRRSSSTVKSGPLVVNNFRGARLGTVNFVQDGHGGLAAVELNGFVPGTTKQNRRYGIVAKAMAARSADIQKYLAERASKRRPA